MIRRVIPIAIAGALLLAVLVLANQGQQGAGSGESQATAVAGPRAGGVVELDGDKQRHIWDLEHVTFVLENYFGKTLSEAVRTGSFDGVRPYLTEGFRATILDSSKALFRRVGPVSERLRDTTAAAGSEVDADGFIGYLKSALSPLRSVTRSRLRVLFIDPEGEAGWTTTFLLSASGSGPERQPVEYELTWTVSVEAEDAEQLKGQGGVLASARLESEVLRQSELLLMEEVTGQTGIDALSLEDNWSLETAQRRYRRYQPAVDDFDLDGYPDIALASPDGRPRLLRSVEGRRFEDVTQAMGILPGKNEPVYMFINATAAWIDYNNDGYPDLLLGHRLYRNHAGERFEDLSRTAGLKFDRVPLGVTVVDFDADGRLDLYIVYQRGFKQSGPGTKSWVEDRDSGAENHLWRNQGDGTFKDVTASAGAGGGANQTFAASAFFYDSDRFPDLYLANDFGRNVLLRNRGDGTFEDVTAGSGAGDYATSMGVTTGDLDNDGNAEIYVANMFSKMGRRIVSQVEKTDYPDGIYEQILGSCAGNRLYRRTTADGPYEEVSVDAGVNEVGWAYAPATVDLDGDGRLDLYATSGYMSFDRHQPDG
jgi:hypothetical protein